MYIRYSPTRSFEASADFLDLFDFFKAPKAYKSFEVNIKETATGYQLEAYLPGFNKEDIHINLENTTLSIEAKKEAKQEEAVPKWVRQERTSETLKRSFELDQTIDENRIDAKYDNGVLQVNLVKTVKESKKIVIN